jgi:hypothetical protein
MFLMRDSKDLSDRGSVADDAYDTADVENEFVDRNCCSTEKAWQCAKYVIAITNFSNIIIFGHVGTFLSDARNFKP